MKAEDLDRLFEKGEEDILPYLDLAKAVRPGHEGRRVNVDFPQWMLARLDLEANRRFLPLDGRGFVPLTHRLFWRSRNYA